MKISLTRFCPKGQPLDSVTYQNMLSKFIPYTGAKTPTASQLEKSDAVILYQYCDDNGRFIILKNGLVIYRYKKKKIVNGVEKLVDRSTVIPTHKSNFSYKYCTGEKVVVPEPIYRGLPFFKVLQMFAYIRIQHNLDSLEETRAIRAIKRADKELLLASTKLGDTESVEQQMDFEQINDALNTLTAPQKEVVVLCYYKKLTQEQVAVILGISRSSVQNRLAGAFNTLRKSKSLAELL